MSARGLDSLRRARRVRSIRPLHDGQLVAAQTVHRALPGTAWPQSPPHKSFQACNQPILSPLLQPSSLFSQSRPSVSTHPIPHHLLWLNILLKTVPYSLSPCCSTCGKNGGRRECASS